MRWKKLGQVFTVSSTYPNTITHASNPLPIHLYDDVYRVFFSARNLENKSSVSFVDIDIHHLSIVYDHKKEIFPYGPVDSFYSHGVSIGNCYQQNGASYILFMGWQIRGNDHWRGDIGRLELVTNKDLVLNPKGTFLSTDLIDPVSLSYPFVLFDEGIFKMWYGSTESWNSENGEMIHVIKFATSNDGENWEKHGIAIPYEIGIAQAFSRPTVIKENGIFHMWYSYRSGTGTKYRIGYSISLGGLKWERKHEDVGIDVSAQGWDSEMICYPFVFDHKGERYMLYNGNSYGKAGFGIAILEK